VPARVRRRSDSLLATALAIGLVGCVLVLSAEPTPTLIEGPAPVLLPGDNELLPMGTAFVGGWIGTSSFPGAFDPDALHADPERVADALAAALRASFAGASSVPVYGVAAVDEQGPGRTLVILTELRAGDDSIAGTQYAVVAQETADGWRLEELMPGPCADAASTRRPTCASESPSEHLFESGRILVPGGGRTAAGASVERPRPRKVRAPQSRLAGNARPP